MGVPRVYRKEDERGIISYSHDSIAEGTGVKNFNGMTTTGDAGSMTTELLYSDDVEIQGARITGTTYGKSIDLDFDLSELNLPRTLRGKLLVNAGFIAKRFAASSGDTLGYLVAKLRKWDGATETEIASTGNSTISDFVGGSEVPLIVAMKMTVPRTHFKKGETIRITVEGWSKLETDGANDSIVVLGTDPYNRDGTHIIPSTDSPASTTKLKFLIPFEVSI